MHYCACNPRFRKDRAPTNLFCWVHRRFVCRNCVVDNSYSNTIVGPYEDWLKNSQKMEYPPRCPLSKKKIDDDPRSSQRLYCLCLFHASSLRENLVSQNPKAMKCPKCQADVVPPESNTNLAKSVNRFVQHVKQARNLSKVDKLLSKNQEIVKNTTSISSSAGNEERSRVTSQDKSLGITRRARPKKNGVEKPIDHHVNETALRVDSEIHYPEKKVKSRKPRSFSCRHCILLLMAFSAIASAVGVLILFSVSDEPNN